MGQAEVLQAVEELGFTTLQELQNDLNVTTRSITNSLTRLTRWKEIETIKFGRQLIYFSREFFMEEISNE